jgi:hypothetical protein
MYSFLFRCHILNLMRGKKNEKMKKNGDKKNKLEKKGKKE